MQITEIPTQHTDWVHQVAFYEYIGCVVSISTCSIQSMLVCNPKTPDAYYIFKVSQVSFFQKQKAKPYNN